MEEEATRSREDITPSMIDAIIAELQYKAEIWEQTGMVSVHCGDVVVKSNSFGEDHLLEDLKAAVVKLEDCIPEDKGDYHPGSDGKVVDLVHPSLYPLIYGRTRIRPDRDISDHPSSMLASCGQGEIIPIPPKHETIPFWPHTSRSGSFGGTGLNYGLSTAPFSRKYQWLPCDVVQMGDGAFRIVSYINNLHPDDHWDLYESINRVIDRAIPLWERTLAPLRTRYKYSRIERPSRGWEYEAVPIGDSQPVDLPANRTQAPGKDRPRRGEFWKWRTVQPEPDPFDLHSFERQYRDKVELSLYERLQIIVKLSNIELTPDKPEYSGGTWHVEGQLVGRDQLSVDPVQQANDGHT